MAELSNNLSSEFVFSAPAYLGLFPNGNIRSKTELLDFVNRIIMDGVLAIKEELKEIDYPMQISLLFNALTEKTFGDNIIYGKRFGFDKIYSDSGGLQIITRGMKITPELKRQVYAVQTKSDYAMCFDTIPVRTECAAHRHTISTKAFYFEDFEKCAKETALDVKEQIEFLTDIGSDTKVIFIVQGNNLDDMVLWFDIATKTIPKDYWNKIHGIAIGGSCFGIGQLEDIEKTIAYGRLRNEFDPHFVKNHLHILGVGAIKRLRPLLILRNTGYIGPDIHVSYDSSTLSMAYIYGALLDRNGITFKNSPIWEDTFKVYYAMVGKVLMNFGFTQEELDSFYHQILSDQLCHDKIYASNDNDRLRVASHCFKCLSNIFQIKIFTQSLCDMNSIWDAGTDPIGMLKYVRTLDDYKEWKAQYGHAVPSRRIVRKGYNCVERFLS